MCRTSKAFRMGTPKRNQQQNYSTANVFWTNATPYDARERYAARLAILHLLSSILHRLLLRGVVRVRPQPRAATRRLARDAGRLAGLPSQTRRLLRAQPRSRPGAARKSVIHRS